MRIRVLLIVVALTAASSSASADHGPGLSASMLFSSGAIFAEQDTYFQLDCETSPFESLFTGSTSWGGWTRATSTTEVRFGDRHVFQAGEEAYRQDPGETFMAGNRLQAGETFRVAFAIWGGTADCRLTVGGDDVELARLDPSRARLLDENSFATGAGLTVAGVGALVGGHLGHAVDGFVWGLLSCEAGRIDARGPEAQRYSGSGVAFTEPSRGEWKFDVDAAAFFGWIVDVPL
jgi:hypothetical protein